MVRFMIGALLRTLSISVMAAALSSRSQNQRHQHAQMTLVDKQGTTTPKPVTDPDIKALMWGVKPDSLYISGTQPNPLSLSTTMTINTSKATSTNFLCWIPAMTADGGPFLHYDVPDYPVRGNAQQASLRNIHESNYNGVLCGHFQDDDRYDANWTHFCSDEDGNPIEWQEGKYAPAGGPPGGLPPGVQTMDKVVIKPGVSDPITEGPGTWNVILWQGTCEGHALIVEFEWVLDFRGIQVLYSSPKLSDACFHQVKMVVIENQLEEWMPVRSNMDGNRPLEDWPW